MIDTQQAKEFRAMAEEMRERARAARHADTRASLLTIADDYERIA